MKKLTEEQLNNLESTMIRSGRAVQKGLEETFLEYDRMFLKFLIAFMSRSQAFITKQETFPAMAPERLGPAPEDFGKP